MDTLKTEKTLTGLSDKLPLTANPMFGMWKDRTDMADVAQYVRQLRTSRFQQNGVKEQE
ncbi:MAG: hypothetical protein RL748_703 [Pseudomonadota bacterium]|jgi:hypothetical protein